MSRSASQTASAAWSVQPPANADKPGEQSLLILVEQPVAPVDRRLQRALALRRVARAAGQHRQAALEPVEDLGRREDLGSGGGQLDRERQPVEALAYGARKLLAR